MKSVIIRQNGKKVIHIKKMPFGVISDVLENIGEIEITVVLENGERIKMSNQKKYK